ncbi:MAG TPA: ABC transporter permease [Gemmatimonadales bacterium]|nr:ABC transporter permease [Gemmatimonadales bacterium]
MRWLRALHQSDVWPMLWKEFLQLRRDRLTVAMMVGLPAIQLLLFGYAIRTEVRHLPTVVLDESRTPESRALVARMINTGNFDLAATVPDREAIRQWIESGRAAAAIVIPPTYAPDLKRGRGAEAQVIVDAADPMSSSAALSGAQLAGEAEALAWSRAAGPPPVQVRVRPWYNPGQRSAVYIVPGIIGVLLSMTLVLITSVSIVREREKGTLEQLIVTPIGKLSIMIGKLAPFVLVGYVQITVILLLGVLLFHVPVAGDVALLYLLALPFIVANLGLGLLLSTLVRTQSQAMQLGFLFLLPNILLSGFMFPRAAMPALAQWIGAALPLTYFLEVLRGILVKGVAAGSLLPQAAALTLFSIGTIAVSVRRFAKTIE